jgi:hypothetical protein
MLIFIEYKLLFVYNYKNVNIVVNSYLVKLNLLELLDYNKKYI